MSSASAGASAPTADPYQDYGYTSSAPTHDVSWLLPSVFAFGDRLGPRLRVLDVGCGNGYIAGQFLSRGHEVVGIDLSPQGVAIAQATYPAGRFERLAAEEDLLLRLQVNPFDVVISTEVIEHIYAPQRLVANCYGALRPGGRLILSTPYHGYLKNVAIAVSGKFDSHVNPLWEGGHIKFWSRKTLSRLLCEAGFRNLQFRGCGRLPYLWKSMVMAADKPG